MGNAPPPRKPVNRDDLIAEGKALVDSGTFLPPRGDLLGRIEARGQLPAFRVRGRLWRIRCEDVEALMAGTLETQ
jgi:hypothetical protein